MTVRRSMLLACLLCVVTALGAARAGAVSCPGSGAKVKIVINNPTTSTGQQVFISGTVLAGLATCGGASDTYATSVTLTSTGDNTFILPVGGGLNTGIWVHHISVGTQFQSQRVTVLYTTDSAQYATVHWTYYPTVVQVFTPGDAGTGTCTSSSCTLRQALNTANAATKPALVQPMLSPGAMSQSSNLVIAGGVTIDGTDPLGHPSIVGDASATAQANQSPFNRAIDLKNTTSLFILGDDAAVRGLAINNTNTSGQPGNNLIEGVADNITIENVRLDGGGSGTCDESCMLSTAALLSLQGDNTRIANVEARAGYASAARLSGVSTVSDSWFHHNYVSGVSGDQVLLQRNLVDLTGRRLGDNAVRNTAAVGVQTIASGEIATERNLIRNSASYGIAADLLGGLDLAHDAVCGNGADGVSVAGFNTAQTVSGTGLATAYNDGHGMDFFDTFQSGTIQINDHNAFTANNDCGFSNRSNITASADGNQWRGATTSCTDSTGVDLCTGSGYSPVSCPSIQSPPDSPVMLNSFVPGSSEPVYPMNAILKGQTIRVQGWGFNAITGNPLAGTTCSLGSSDVSSANCCRKTNKANVCVGGGSSQPTAPSDGSMCVAMVDQVSSWYPLAVTSVTPTTMVSEIPSAAMLCIGDAGTSYLQSIRVVKLDSLGNPSSAQRDYCRN